jgi:hypothetical protein
MVVSHGRPFTPIAGSRKSAIDEDKFAGERRPQFWPDFTPIATSETASRAPWSAGNPREVGASLKPLSRSR